MSHDSSRIATWHATTNTTPTRTPTRPASLWSLLPLANYRTILEAAGSGNRLILAIDGARDIDHPQTETVLPM